MPSMTTYLESSAGVEAGGKTGLTVIFTSIFFGISLFLAPLALVIPSAATGPVLIFIGINMLSAMKNIDYSDITEYIPAFLCVTFTIFANNIANGICVALPAYLVMKIATGKIKKIDPVMYVLVAVCLLYFYSYCINEMKQMEKIQLLIKHAKVFNSYLKKFIDADVSVKDGKFYYIDRKHENLFDAEHTIDADGQYMIPGMVDIHMHIESSMTTPGSFGNCAAKNGVTTVVSEPHEMANVKGVRGILEMISAAKDAPIDIFYGIPSSVPSTSEKLETTGGVIDFEAMKHLLGEKDVVCVGEIMNYREIIRENHLEITKFLDYLRQEHPGYVIEGHCPSLVDLDLAKFLYLGINGDHTEHTLEEVKQRIENGMFFEIQDKMLKPEVLSYICENHLFEYCSFVTDDTMADVLYEQGHLNTVVQKAIEMGFPKEQAIYCATYTPCQRMHFYDRGVIAPGKLADFILLKDPAKLLEPETVFKNGISIYKKRTDRHSP